MQRYWKQLPGLIQDGKVDPAFVVSHRMPLARAKEAYKLFLEKEDSCMKIVLTP